MCTLLQYFCDCELRHRVEAIIAFSDKFVSQIQSNQKQRYNELMLAFTMSAAETARKTREFRSPPQEQVEFFFQVLNHVLGSKNEVTTREIVQVNMLMNFKNCSEDEECPVPDEVRESMLTFHTALLGHCGWPPPRWVLSCSSCLQPWQLNFRPSSPRCAHRRRGAGGRGGQLPSWSAAPSVGKSEKVP